MGEPGQPSVTRQLAEAAGAISFDDIPPDAVFLAKQCLLDWLGCAIAGSREPLTVILRDGALGEGGNPQATLIGSGERVSAMQAALVNGAASHALDYDDVHLGMSGHPTVPVMPAALALAEHRGASGRELLAAFIAGFEMECRLGALVMPGHYAAGWHATGTLGTFGAAAACCHLLGLPLEQWQQALGVAGAQAAGLKSMFGTMCKPLHAGKAAANGLLAARLAAAGFTSNTEVLDTPQGFTATQTTTAHPERALEGLGETLAIRGVLFKYHAACYGTHETIEGVLRLKQRHNLGPGDVRSITLTVPPGNLAMCNIAEPQTALEGKFSMRFTAALALAGDNTTDQAFTDESVANPELTMVRDCVVVQPADGRGAAGTEVRMSLADGRELTEHVNLETPASDLDLQWQRLERKFLGLASPIVGADRAALLVEAVRGIDSAHSVQDIMRYAIATVEAAR